MKLFGKEIMFIMKDLKLKTKAKVNKCLRDPHRPTYDADGNNYNLYSIFLVMNT